MSWQSEFLQSHRLDEAYLSSAAKWFTPLAAQLAVSRAGASGPILLAVNGSQGSGKSTLCDYLVATLKYEHQLSAIALSLDDFYYTHEQRAHLAQTVHPLLATRGVPGTHDMVLLNSTLDALLSGGEAEAAVPIPRFDKAMDDRTLSSESEFFSGAPDIVILEGWCLGAAPQDEGELALPVNLLENREDKDGRWRRTVNEAIVSEFVALYDRVDLWLMLRAPSFDCIYRWRLEQEQKLAAGAVSGLDQGIMNEAEILRFIQYYQRITEQCLEDLPDRVHYLYQLDENRNVVDYRYRRSVSR